MFGTALIGPDAQPSVTRILIVRLRSATARLRSADAYLPTQGSIADDMAKFGVPVEDFAVLDRRLADSFTGGSSGFDQIPISTYRSLAEVFDRSWLESRPLIQRRASETVVKSRIGLFGAARMPRIGSIRSTFSGGKTIASGPGGSAWRLLNLAPRMSMSSLVMAKLLLVPSKILR
jgi:hypothetical protein